MVKDDVKVCLKTTQLMSLQMWAAHMERMEGGRLREEADVRRVEVKMTSNGERGS